MEDVITSRQNNLVKSIRGLHDKRTREKERRVFLEGVKLIKEALVSGVLPEKLIISEDFKNRLLAGEIIFPSGSWPVITVSDSVMEYMCETETPQGVGAVIKIPETLLRDVKVVPESLIVVLEGVQDPGNVGTIVRTADAFGAHAVILTSGCADLYNAKTLRSTMGSVFHIPVVRDVDISGLTAFLIDNGILTAVTSLDKTSRSLPEADLPRPLAVVLGSETKGVSPGICRIAGAKLKIPMEGLAQSLNVAVAAGIVLYEAFRQKL
ncbi:MAG: hypothetical protein CVV03_10080 [Firmicutes bacterium HGW-Firmicutes-8]|nr:MAG: hypothetical protein CVV03_10080 [Firmicutes bacterium HGW-Firmicutes-8]